MLLVIVVRPLRQPLFPLFASLHLQPGHPSQVSNPSETPFLSALVGQFSSCTAADNEPTHAETLLFRLVLLEISAFQA